MKTPSAEYVRQAFDYEPDTGRLMWKKHRPAEHFVDESYSRRWHSRCAGKEAANIALTGYKRVNIGGTVHLVHRIIWMIVHGEFPETIDHINGDRADNRWSNLRAVSKIENSRNMRIAKHNTSGVVGVSECRRSGRWHAYIGIGENGKRKFLGRFKHMYDAIAARRAAERELGYHPNHGTAGGKPDGRVLCIYVPNRGF